MIPTVTQNIPAANDSQKFFIDVIFSKDPGMWKSEVQKKINLKKCLGIILNRKFDWEKTQEEFFECTGHTLPNGTIPFRARGYDYDDFFCIDIDGVFQRYKVKNSRHADNEVIVDFTRPTIVNSLLPAVEEKLAEIRESERILAERGVVLVNDTQYEIFGEVIWGDWRATMYGSSFKIKVKDPRGFTVYGSLPKAVINFFESKHWDIFDLVGMKVKFRGKISVSDTDANFAFYSYPKNFAVDEDDLAYKILMS